MHIDRIFSRFDEDGNKVLDVQEFLKMMIPKDCVIKKDLMDTLIPEYIR